MLDRVAHTRRLEIHPIDFVVVIVDIVDKMERERGGGRVIENREKEMSACTTTIIIII